MQTTSNKEYWSKKIIEWENSMDGNGGDTATSWVEQLAARFRNPVKFRADLCLDVLHPFAKGKTVLELGCGSGFFAFRLFERCQPAHITGIDIAESAVKRAQDLAAAKHLSDRFSFMAAEAVSSSLPNADVTIGLGFLDYLSPEDIRSLFKKMPSRYFLFSFSEKVASMMRAIHIGYLWSQNCSQHFYQSKKELTDYIGESRGPIQFINHKKLSFACIVHNLPANR